MEIKPFKAYRFDAGLVGDVGSCIAPPYDVINDKYQQKLYEKNQYNIVRITKGKLTPADSETDNQYTRAADFLNRWLEKGVFKPDQKEMLYAYVQNFRIRSADFQRSGFIALGKLSEFGSTVKPHEKTLDGPKADRLKLTRATKTQFGQIFMLYDDDRRIADNIIEKIAAAEKPLIDFIDDDGVRHRLFAIAKTDDIETVRKMMTDKSTIIADGHHRYETALNYYKETDNPAAQYQMMTFVNMKNQGLVILPTHRLISRLENFDAEKIIAGLKNNFDIRQYDFADNQQKIKAKEKMLESLSAEFNAGNCDFGIYTGSKFRVITLKNKKAMDAIAPNLSQASKQLDVSILHRLIIETILGIGDKQLAAESNIEYIKDNDLAVAESIAKIDAGSAQIMFFMNPTRIEQVKDVASAGEKMPQKSTFFYPKIFTGLTINRM